MGAAAAAGAEQGYYSGANDDLGGDDRLHHLQRGALHELGHTGCFFAVGGYVSLLKPLFTSPITSTVRTDGSVINTSKPLSWTVTLDTVVI